jgi:hypothetical protein
MVSKTKVIFFQRESGIAARELKSTAPFHDFYIHRRKPYVSEVHSNEAA